MNIYACTYIHAYMHTLPPPKSLNTWDLSASFVFKLLKTFLEATEANVMIS